jgi:Mce-associated membrane protein
MTDDSAVVLVASTSEVSNSAGAKQNPRSYRLLVTITRDGDQLKMSKVEFAP